MILLAQQVPVEVYKLLTKVLCGRVKEREKAKGKREKREQQINFKAS